MKYRFNLTAKGAVMERQLQRANAEFASGNVPESIWQVANSMLADEARKLAFATRRPYIDCQREVLARRPELYLGVKGFQLDKKFPQIEFTQEDDDHVDT